MHRPTLPLPPQQQQQVLQADQWILLRGFLVGAGVALVLVLVVIPPKLLGQAKTGPAAGQNSAPAQFGGLRLSGGYIRSGSASSAGLAQSTRGDTGARASPALGKLGGLVAHREGQLSLMYAGSSPFIALHEHAAAAVPASSAATPACPPDHHFEELMHECTRLRQRYDLISSKLFSLASSPRSRAKLSTLKSQLTEKFEADCGSPAHALEQISLERVRARELKQRCATSKALPRTAALAPPSEPCGTCGALLDLEPLDWERLDSALGEVGSLLLDTAKGTKGEGKASWGPYRVNGPTARPGSAGWQPTLRVAWPVWRRGGGMTVGAGCPSREAGTGTEIRGDSREAMEDGGTTSTLTSAPASTEGGADRTSGDRVPAAPHKKASAEAGPSRRLTTASIFLQYWKQPENLQPSVDTFLRCGRGFNGSETTPASPVPVELLANVDQPGESALWTQAWRKWNFEVVNRGNAEPGGEYLFVVFNHNYHEVHGYNFLARAAKGDVLIAVQDDDRAPTNCTWLNRITALVDNHPLTAGVAYYGSVKYQGMWLMGFIGEVMQDDPVTGLRSEFVEYMDIGPMILLRCNWVEVGGFDDAFSPRGESGIMSDWDVSLRQWLSGRRIIAVHTPGDLMKAPSGAPAATHVSLSLSSIIRGLNQGISGGALGRTRIVEKYADVEVRSVTKLMHPQDPFKSA